MSERFQHFLCHLGPELYSFAYALLPDDLQAYQISIDSILAHSLELQDVLGVTDINNYELSEQELKLHTLKLYSKTYELTLKRFSQIGPINNAQSTNEGHYKYFYELTYEEKSVLFIRHHTDLSLNETGIIMGMSRSDILALINSGRQKITKLIRMDQIDVPLTYEKNNNAR